MAIDQKLDSTKDKVGGKVKEVEGRVTGDHKKQAEGQTEQVVGHLKGKLADAKEKAQGVVDEAKSQIEELKTKKE